MQFNSTLYVSFLALVVVLYYHLGTQNRRILLLAASYCFYAVWSVAFAGLLAVSTALDYAAARFIDSSTTPFRRKLGLWFSIVKNMGVLCLFKYADFISSSLWSLLGFRPWPELNLILPLGISFFTFQIMSYTIDVYRGLMPAKRSLLDVALYITFFPQLVAGPIVRAATLMPQLQCTCGLDGDKIRRGCALVVWGLAKKVLVADAMAHLVNEVYGAPDQFSGLSLLLATYAFAVQIYCDFSGYSDIAIGSALMLGIDLPKNFDSPYLACSIREFWQRWHISLSTWLRDYLYIPLGGNRRGAPRAHLNLMITMLLGGLWHGAGWTWVIWGAGFAFLMSVERVLGIAARPPSTGLRRLGRWALTFHLVCLSWVLFRAKSLDTAALILGRIFTFAAGGLSIGLPAVLFLVCLLAAERIDLKKRWTELLGTKPVLARWAVYGSMAFFALVFTRVSNPEFIYFQF